MRELVPEAVSALKVWNTAIRLDVFSTHSLSAEASFCHRRVGKLIREWEKQGLVKRTDQAGPRGRKVWKMANEGRLPAGMSAKAKAKREESLLGNLWTAMRMLGNFTPRDLMLTARTEAIDISLDDATAYCRTLAKGETPYLRAIRKASPGKHEAQYRLVRNTGPLPPRERRIRVTYDPNIDAFSYHGGQP